MGTLTPLKLGRRIVPAVVLAAICAASLRAQEKAPGDVAGAPVSVRIDNFTFTPAEIEVRAGTTVEWANNDDIPHTVTALNKAFRSKVLDTEQKYSFTFTASGTYDYFCSLHPHMKGKVIVK